MRLDSSTAITEPISEVNLSTERVGHVTAAAAAVRASMLAAPCTNKTASSDIEMAKRKSSLEGAPIYVKRNSANFVFMFEGRLICAEFYLAEQQADEAAVEG